MHSARSLHSLCACLWVHVNTVYIRWYQECHPHSKGIWTVFKVFSRPLQTLHTLTQSTFIANIELTMWQTVMQLQVCVALKSWGRKSYQFFSQTWQKQKLSYGLLEEKHVLYIQITPPSWSLLHCLLGSVNSASVSECGAKTRHCGQSHRKLRRQTTSHPVWALEETLPPSKQQVQLLKISHVKAAVLCWEMTTERLYVWWDLKPHIADFRAFFSVVKNKMLSQWSLEGNYIHNIFKWIKGNNKATLLFWEFPSQRAFSSRIIHNGNGYNLNLRSNGLFTFWHFTVQCCCGATETDSKYIKAVLKKTRRDRLISHSCQSTTFPLWSVITKEI